MPKYIDPRPLDYRFGGDTLGDFAEKYMDVIAYIINALNEIDASDKDDFVFKKEGNIVWIRNEDDTGWIKFVEITTDVNGNTVLEFLGDSAKWCGKTCNVNNIQDGQVLVWSNAAQAFVNRNQAGSDIKKLTIKRGDDIVAEYDGSEDVVYNDEYIYGSNDLIEKNGNGDLTISNNGTGMPVKMTLTPEGEVTFGDNSSFTKHFEYDAEGNITIKEDS